MTRTALVTGACGFIGRHVARQLASLGCEVVGVGHGEWTLRSSKAWGLSNWRSAEINAETLFGLNGRPDLIVHCAGAGSVPHSMERPEEDFNRTVATTLAVLEFARMHAPEASLVFPSSAAVYGRAETMPIRVADPLHPVSPYGVHKRIAEDLCLSYATHFGLRVAIVRLFSVYGVGLRKQLVWDACCKMTAGDFRFHGTGRETRDWLHVDDAAALLIRALDHASEQCPIVNGGSGIQTDIKAVVEGLAARLGATDLPLFEGAVRTGDPSHFCADISGARGWNWAPDHNLEAELDAYVEWFKRGAP